MSHLVSDPRTTPILTLGAAYEQRAQTDDKFGETNEEKMQIPTSPPT